MAEVMITGAGLQDTQIGAKTGTSVISVSTVDGLPLVADGEFASLIVQMLGSVEAGSEPAENPVAGGKTLPPDLPLADGEIPGTDPELLATLVVPAGTVVTGETPDPVVAGADGEQDGNAQTGDPVSAALSASSGARRAHTAVSGMLTGDRRQDSAALQPDRSGRATPGAIDATAVKAMPDLQSPVVATGDTKIDLPGVSSSSPLAMPQVVGTHSAVARAPMDSAPIPMQQRGFEQALGDRVVWMTNNRIQSAELQVNPPELGPIEVRIQVSNDQASVSFGALQPATRDALEAALPRLRELLGQQGLNLSDVNVSQHSQANERGDSSAAGTHIGERDETSSGDAQESARVTIGMLDVFA